MSDDMASPVELPAVAAQRRPQERIESVFAHASHVVFTRLGSATATALGLTGATVARAFRDFLSGVFKIAGTYVSGFLTNPMRMRQLLKGSAAVICVYSVCTFLRGFTRALHRSRGFTLEDLGERVATRLFGLPRSPLPREGTRHASRSSDRNYHILRLL